ncbi:hypothetical protein F2Q70_00044604 [Brassica cretica]|uniref:Non-specific serine/threonine protein kinase n=1 Tax=Brassica cretica TaxID=69181 RepID=A0A8S9KCT9_BRACR|nr:hypothetical protein F2Q70_00044604 [Brassica cretica]
MCNRTGGRVIGISISETNFKEWSPLNLSLLHPFDEVRSLNLSGILNQLNGLFDDVEGYNSFSSLQSLEYLSLADNNFTGLFSFSPLANLNNLKVLKLSSPFGLVEVDPENNDISGVFPDNIGHSLPESGSIPNKLCELSNIRLLDISDNKLNGFIPSCLSNLSFALGGEEERSHFAARISTVPNLQLEFYRSTFVVDTFGLSYFIFTETEIHFAAKQRYDSYTGVSKFTGGTLDYMYGLDLSSNELGGPSSAWPSPETTSDESISKFLVKLYTRQLLQTERH